MSALTIQQRNVLESAVKQARKLAEAGAHNALRALAVDSPEAFGHMNPDQRTLRNRLRSKARLLGDELLLTGHQQTNQLGYELAYEYWHKMLFAKFLESNGLLIHPSGVAVAMEECDELAKEEGFADKWEAAATYASRMLPAIFRPEDPLMQVNLASNDRIKLEEILDSLDSYTFIADDALGWVYQFWQSDAKKAINDSQEKINGEKLPAVTQLFTEPYMVHFLIDNTIGAWWMSHYPNEPPPLKFEYLRLLDDGTPAAGKFEKWPNRIKEITSLDPCMGSGHFIVSLFLTFAKLRIYEEGLSKEMATDKVISENLHGLELDARCTQIAAFNLALTAWKFCGHYKPLPEMNLACSGIAPKGKKEDWVKLVGKVSDAVLKARMENGIKVLFDHFQLAPELGSLLDPGSIKPDAFTASFEELQPTLIKALTNEADNDQIERGVMAAGIAKAGRLLAKKYTIQITNVPYLARRRQASIVYDFSEDNYPDAKGELATVFLKRMITGVEVNGTISCVIPQNWLFQTSYKKFRETLLKSYKWDFLLKLGAGAFSQISGEVVKPILLILSNSKIIIDHEFYALDVSIKEKLEQKKEAISDHKLETINQTQQLKNPDSRIITSFFEEAEILKVYANAWQGIASSDKPRFSQLFWEQNNIKKTGWKFQQGSVVKNNFYTGRETILFWEDGYGEMTKVCQDGAAFRGKEAWNKKGVIVSLMNNLPATLYSGELFDFNCSPIIPENPELIPALWCFCSSPKFNQEMRKIDQKLNVTNATLVKIPFDLEFWQKIAEEEYPNGLPKPYSDDATQWLFHGHPGKADNPLQVAVARLMNYRWPLENDSERELADEAEDLMKQIKTFDNLTDEDGILCIPSVNGELAASEKLRSYLQSIYSTEWSNNTISKLLTKEGAQKQNLEEWLREEFFEQHCKLFQNRPFIWHIWDGRKDGFSAIVNYHKLNKQNLQHLIFTYLGDWIRQCEAKKKSGESGAEGLLSAATKLKEKLRAILEGENPYDIFVRWKSLEKQPIGWEPDLNDGIRLNIRPFIIADVLRKKPNIKWGTDRGKNSPGSCWGELRDNDSHLALEEKRKKEQ